MSYKHAEKLIKKIKKQKHPNKILINQAISEISAGMKRSLPEYSVHKGVIIFWHGLLA